MDFFQTAGIYVMVDLSTWDDPNDPQGVFLDYIMPAWNSDVYSIYSEIVSSFANYTNVLGFVIGEDESER
jgi:1,3-beta-glucanosyltransferase GAS1